MVFSYSSDNPLTFNTLRLGQNGRHLADDIFRCIFLKENMCILIWISPKFVHKGPINNQSATVQVMAWCRQTTSHYLNHCWPISLLPYGVLRPQWVKYPIWSVGLLPVMYSDRKKKHWSLTSFNTKQNKGSLTSSTYFFKFHMNYDMV